jgi:proprotein convertase subtilisin/kexin type 5
LNCTSCFNGYVLASGSCIFSPLNSALPPDAGCALWNWSNQTCVACSHFWFFKNGVCTPVSDLCKTYDNVIGVCLTCYLGYDLVNGNCVISTTNSKSDIGCANWNWTSQVCLSCSPYWVLVNGACHSVSPYCKTYDSTGICTSCFTGYSLSNGTCSAVLTLCRTQDSNGICLTCYNGYALYQGQCVTLNSIANIALYYAACCP